ncbi:MAG: hypothetical protein ACUVUP_02930 [Thermaceae bacterium]
MSLDDLLGLLFLLFFIILPALSSLFRGPQAGLPPLETPPGPETPRPRPKKPPRPPEPPKDAESPKPTWAFPPPEKETPRPHLSKPSEEERERPRPRLVLTTRNAIRKGVVWHEILKKPKGW